MAKPSWKEVLAARAEWHIAVDRLGPSVKEAVAKREAYQAILRVYRLE